MASFVPLVVLLGLLLGACRESQSALVAPSWKIRAERIWQGEGDKGAALARCDTAGRTCRAIELDEPLALPCRVHVSPRSRATLRLDRGTTLELGVGTQVLFAATRERRARLLAGSLSLWQRTEGQELALEIEGFTARRSRAGRMGFSASRAGGGRATLTVHGGHVLVTGGGHLSKAIPHGRTVELLRTGRIDEHAVFAGRVAPVRPVRAFEAGVERAPPEPAREGRMTARVPGSSAVVSGVSRVDHRVRTLERDGLSRTEIEEEFLNETDRVLEGRYTFVVPPGASVSRLGLWVGDELVEGEVVERQRAARIFDGIVDDSVRPRDPALLEWSSGGEYSLRVFPIEPKRTRRVVIAYDEVLGSQEGEGAPKASVYWPSWQQAHDARPAVAAAAEEDGYFALELVAALPPGMEAPPFAGTDRVLVLDRSFSQTEASAKAAVVVARALLDDLDEDEGFAVLVCDSACDAHPSRGLRLATPRAILDAGAWLEAAMKPRGATDLAGALVRAAAHFRGGRRGQLVYVGDGRVTAGELSPGGIVSRVEPVLARSGAWLRLLGLGRTLDEVLLRGLAEDLGGTYDAVASRGGLQEHLHELVLRLRAPRIEGARLELSGSVEQVLPERVGSVVLGQRVLVVGKLSGPGGASITLRGKLEGRPYRITGALTAPTPAQQNPLLPRLWAERRIAFLEARGDPAREEIVALSERHHVLSRRTSLLVLENDAMFAAYGIPRTQHAGHGRLSGSHKATAPRVRMGVTDVSGRLPPEIVQRVVRQSYGRFRMCYERGLGRDPQLKGRVTARFVIGRDGRVTSAADAGSTLGDAEVIDCVVKSYGGLVFPEPDGGIVTVVYPIQLSPGWDPPSTASSGVARARAATPKHSYGSERWRQGSDAAITAARRGLERGPQSRQAHRGLLLALFWSGRFEVAQAEAEKLAALDPDDPWLHEALAWSAALRGDGPGAALEMATRAELEAPSPVTQQRTAQAFEAAGDSVRACAHWRAVAALDAVSPVARDAVARCRAAETSRAAEDPVHGALGWFTARLECSAPGKRCPVPLVVTPLGRVVSPWTPEEACATVERVDLRRRTGGRYRTLAVGGEAGAQATLTVFAQGTALSRTFTSTGEATTLIESDVP